MAMEHCKDCGKEIPPGGTFKICSKCGIKRLLSVSKSITRDAGKAIKKARKNEKRESR
jgi:hypothetical protein